MHIADTLCNSDNENSNNAVIQETEMNNKIMEKEESSITGRQRTPSRYEEKGND